VSLYKRGSVYWSVIWIDGVRTMRSLETGNRRRAEALEQRLRDELHARRFQLPNLKPEMTLSELYARFLAEGDVKPHHIDRAKMFLPYFADTPIGQVTKNEIARYRKERHAEYLARHGQVLSASTVNRDVEVIRHLLFWATDEGIIAANPIARIRMARERGRHRPIVSVADELKVLDASAPHLRSVVIAALDTGMRRGELLNQSWEHVDFDRNVLSVTRSKTAEGEHRLLPLTGRLRTLLDEMSADARERNQRPSGLIFTYDDQPIHSLKTAWAGALRRAGLAHFPFHSLRHTFNSRLVDLGVIAEVRKELMGHSRGGDVNSIYTHVELPTLRDAIVRLDTWHTDKVRALRAGHNNQTTHNEPAKERKDEMDDRKQLATPAA
jgi:integrase